MKKLIQLSLTTVAAGCCAFAPFVVSATTPEPVFYTFYFDTVDMAANLASGTYTSMGFLNDNGAALEEFALTQPNAKGEQTAHGTKTLVNFDLNTGVVSTLMMKFNVQIAPLAAPEGVLLPDGRYGIAVTRGTGRFVIQEGTGAYANLHGQGSAMVNLIMLLDDEGLPIMQDGQPVVVLTAVYSGQAHLDP